MVTQRLPNRFAVEVVIGGIYDFYFYKIACFYVVFFGINKYLIIDIGRVVLGTPYKVIALFAVDETTEGLAYLLLVEPILIQQTSYLNEQPVGHNKNFKKMPIGS